MGTNSSPNSWLKRLASGLAVLLPVFALVVMLSLASPATSVSADPESTVVIDTVGCDVTATAGANTTGPVGGNCNAAEVFTGVNGGNTNATANGSATGVCPLTDQVTVPELDEACAAYAASAASNPDAGGAAFADADAAVNQCNDVDDLNNPIPGAPNENNLEGPIRCLALAGAAAATEDIGVATSTADATINACGVDRGTTALVEQEANCVATSSSISEAGDCDFDNNGDEANSCVAVSEAASTVTCGDTGDNICSATTVADSRAEDCDDDADCAANAGTDNDEVTATVVCTEEANCIADANAEAETEGCFGSEVTCTSNANADATIASPGAAGGAGCIGNDTSCTAEADADADVEDCDGTDGLTECTATANSTALIDPCTNGATCVSGAGANGTNEADAEADNCTISVCIALSTANGTTEDCADALTTCTTDADAFTEAAECDDNAGCFATATSNATIADDAVNSSPIAALFGVFIPDVDTLSCDSGVNCVADAFSNAEAENCDNDATCNADATADAAVENCFDIGLGNPDQDCIATASADADIWDCDTGANCNAGADADATIYDCSGADCIADADAIAEIENCDDLADCNAFADAGAFIWDCNSGVAKPGCTAEADAEVEIEDCGNDDAVLCDGEADALAVVINCQDADGCTAEADAEVEIENCTVMAQCIADATGTALVIDCRDDVSCTAIAEAEASIEDCEESLCEADADAFALVINCDGAGIDAKDFFCSAVALAEANVDGCDPNTCSADADSIAIVANCDADPALTPASVGGCSAEAFGQADAIWNSTAEADNTAIANGCLDPGIFGFCFGEMGYATASAKGDALAVNGSDAEVENEAYAIGSGTTAVAGSYCVQLLDINGDGDVDADDEVCSFGGATAINNSVAEADNDALAIGQGGQAIDPDLENLNFGSAAYALGGAIAENDATALQDNEAEAGDGGLAISIANAVAYNGATASAESVQQAQGGTYSPDGELNGNCINDQNGDGICNGVFTPSAAAGITTAIAGPIVATEGAFNEASASSAGVAVGGGTVASSTTAISIVDSGIFGGAVAGAIGCTQGQVSCGNAGAVALASGSEGIALAETLGNAAAGQDVNVTAGAVTPATAGTCGSPSGAYAGLTLNPDGSWSFSGGFNAGLACADANVSAKP